MVMTQNSQADGTGKPGKNRVQHIPGRIRI